MRSRLPAFFLGLLAGALSIWPLCAWPLEGAHLERDALLLQVETLEHRLERLQETTASMEPVVESLEVETDLSETAAGRLALEKALLTLLKDLLGKPIAQVDPLLLKSTLHQRVLRVGEKYYQVELQYFILGPKTLAVFHVAPAPSP
ncbi:MAG: hypothetical protein QJR00_01595 [Bacillota bacterium]|nr:hypothetical protein [Bacillota bacterium]